MFINMLFFTVLGSFIMEANSYVLLQVRKQNKNYSNVDALIHKVVPSEKLDQMAEKLGAKQPIEVKHDTEEAKQIKSDDRETDANEKRDLKKENEFAANIEKTILNFVKKGKAMFRSQNEYVKPKFVNFRNSKPSLVLEIDSKAIVRTIKDLLASKTFQTYMKKFARKAGVVYRAIKEEIDKEY